MAEEAFALSPIAARATQPSEADYDAIREAFMETSRGRWFLGEYAKRNRNADTRLVLDAVARIEETLAAQKKPVRDPMLDEALAAFRNALGEAKDASQAALGDLALEENLAPVRKGARVIREISWRLREIGADGRICDLIDSQVSAIEGAAAKMVPDELAAALSDAFDLIEARIAAFDAGNAEMPIPPSAEAALSEAALSEAFDEAASPAAEALAEGAAAAAPPAGELADWGETVETPAGGQALGTENASGATTVVEAEPVDAFNADDEAMLDRIALEMAAPDTDAAYEPPMDELICGAMAEDETPVAEAPLAHTPPAGTSLAAENDSISADDIEITFVSDAGDVTDAGEPPQQPVRAVSAVAAPIEVAPQAREAEPAPSLGSSLLANGIVQRPRISKPDSLAPIRRMSQSEKIAFFS